MIRPTATSHLYRQEKRFSIFSGRGLWGMILFCSISVLALVVRDHQLLAALPGTVRALLGESPPPALIHVALAVSTLSSLILLLGRSMDKLKPGYSWLNIAMPMLFYPLYLIADTERTTFIIVFATGLIILMLEHFTMHHCLIRAMHEVKGPSGKRS